MSQVRAPPGARRSDASRLQLKCRDLMGRQGQNSEERAGEKDPSKVQAGKEGWGSRAVTQSSPRRMKESQLSDVRKGTFTKGRSREAQAPQTQTRHPLCQH